MNYKIRKATQDNIAVVIEMGRGIIDKCVQSSPRANAFYKKMGWVEAEVTENEGVSMVVYKKIR